MTVNDLPHNQLLNMAGIKLKELSPEAKTSIESINQQFKGYLIKKTPATLEKIKAQSKVLQQHIYDYFVEDGDATTIAGMASDIKDNNEPNGNSSSTSNSSSNVGNNSNGANIEPPKVQKKTDPNETALKSILESGKMAGITKKDLAEAGFDIGMWTTPIERHGCVIGAYVLLVENRQIGTYTLAKR